MIQNSKTFGSFSKSNLCGESSQRQRKIQVIKSFFSARFAIYDFARTTSLWNSRMAITSIQLHHWTSYCIVTLCIIPYCMYSYNHMSNTFPQSTRITLTKWALKYSGLRFSAEGSFSIIKDRKNKRHKKSAGFSIGLIREVKNTGKKFRGRREFYR